MAAMNHHPPAHLGPNAGNAQPRPNSGVPSSGQQDLGPYAVGQDPTHLHPQHQFSARPVFYVPAPPPPPFLHYQWPMPFSYNPFTGFPGMGYGMVMPSFTPPTYMEAPAYILPHPHIQPIDYRRLLPQAHPAQGAPFPNPNQIRRVRPAFAPVPVRETVNSEVQTEPQQRGGFRHGSPPTGADSGHVTASNSSSSSTSSSQKQRSAEVENFSLPSSNTKDFEDKRTCTGSSEEHGFNVLRPSETKSVQSYTGASVHMQKNIQEKLPLCKNSRCNMWSMGSSDSIVPVCSSSQQEDEVVKERRISVPDILMSWGGGTPQALRLKMVDKMAPQTDQQLLSYETEVEPNISLYQSLTDYKNVPGADDDAEGESERVSSRDGENLFKILKLPFDLNKLLSETREPSRSGYGGQHLPNGDKLLHSLCDAQEHHEQENRDELDLQEDTTEIVPYQTSLNGLQMKRKMNESVWSVESLAPFFPNRQWLQQNGVLDPQITEKAKNGLESSQEDKLILNSSQDRRRSHRLSSSDSVLMSDSWLIYSTPASKKRSEVNASEISQPKQSQSVSPTCPSLSIVSPKCLLSEIIVSTAEDVDEDGSPEPEANRSPNQESIIVKEQQERENPHSPEQEEMATLSCMVQEKTPFMNPMTPQNRIMERLGSDFAHETTNDVDHMRNEQLHIPTEHPKMVEVSPSKGHLVDCGVQCTELQERCFCEEMKCGSVGAGKGSAFNRSDMKKENIGNAEVLCMNGPMQKNQRRQRRNNREVKRSRAASRSPTTYMAANQGKSKGWNGRNQQY